MNNPCTTPFRKGKRKRRDETTFSAPYTPKKGPFPQTFPKRKVDHYSSKPQDYNTKPANFLHRFHNLYTSPSHSSSDKEEKVFSSFEKWLIYNESSVEKTISGKTVGRGMGEGGIEEADDAAPRSIECSGKRQSARDPSAKKRLFCVKRII